MSWVYRFLCILCLGGYWIAYGDVLSWRMPVIGLFVFALACGLPNIGACIFIVSYPILLYLNQYPEHHFSAATFLVITVVLGLSLRKPATLSIPLAVIALYFSISLVRNQPDPASILQGIWATSQFSPTLFVGTCIMWAAGVMLFDFLRRMKPVSLYYALAAQGAVFAAMCVANIWLRQKSVAWQYQFLFGDVHAFAAYLVLQVGLLAGLWRKGKLGGKAAACALFIVYSLLIVASYSRSGLTAYFAMAFLFITVLATRWIPELLSLRFYRHNWTKVSLALLGLLILSGAAVVYPPSDLIAKAKAFYERIESVAPESVKRELIPRLADLKNLFYARIEVITPDIVYAERVRMWAVALDMVRDHPIFGIGVGKFYQTSAEYGKRVPPDVGAGYPENAHNYYLQIAAETGLVGLILFLGFLVWLFWKHWKLGDPIKLGCGIALAGLLVFSLTQHPLLVDRVFFVFVMICAIMAGRNEHEI